MGFRFKNRQKAYAPVASDCCDKDVSAEHEHEQQYEPVVILARLTQESLDETHYAYRVATSDGNVAIVNEDELVSDKDYNKEDNGGDEPEEKTETEVESPAEAV